MFGSGETARVTPVIDLLQRQRDLNLIDLVTGVMYVETDGLEAEIRFMTSDTIPDSWLRTIRIRLTHMATGRKANGKLNNATVMSRSNSGITIKVKPLLPSMGRIGREHFRVDIVTASGLKRILLCAASARGSAASERKAAGDLTAGNSETHTCKILPFRRPPKRKPASC